MLVFEEQSPQEAWKTYKSIRREVINEPSDFLGFLSFSKKIIFGKYKVLDRFQLTHYSFYRDNTPLATVTYFQPHNDPSFPCSLGNWMVRNDITNLEANAIAAHLRAAINLISEQNNQEVLSPYNGHFSLGFSHPLSKQHDGSFLTSPWSEGLNRIFDNPTWKKERRMLSLETTLNQQLIDSLKQQLAQRSENINHRPISKIHFHRDLQIYLKLVNKCMSGHYRFYPLSPEEDYQLMKELRWIFLPEYFQFLTIDDNPIGFCFAIPDWNQAINNGNELINGIKLLSQSKKVDRARIIYSGILPEYQGKGLFKYVRHAVLIAMAKNGISTVESSYVDEENFNSQGNVKSTGAQLKSEYLLYKL